MFKPTFAPNEFRSPAQHFCISIDGRQIAYCYIRKNACTAFKYFMSGNPSILLRLKKFLGRRKYNDPDNIVNIRHLSIAQNAFNNSDYCETIFVYRDPVERAIATYLNKFVDKKGAADILRNFEVITGGDPDSASFRNFLEYASFDFSLLDCHLWPQKSHLWDIEYTSAIDIRALLDEMTRLVGAKLAGRYFSQSVNSSGSHPALISQSLMDVPALKLREMKSNGAAIDKICFSNDEVMQFMKQRYRNDFLMINELRQQRHV